MRVELNWSTVKEPDEYGLIPPGYFKAMVVGYEKKKKKTADPTSPYYYIELKVKIIEGEYSNRILFHKLNICNENASIMEWHQGVLKKIFRLCGHPEGTEYEQILNIPLMIEVSTRPFSKTDNKLVNEIKHYLEINDALLAVRYAFPIPQQERLSVPPIGFDDDIEF